MFIQKHPEGLIMATVGHVKGTTVLNYIVLRCDETKLLNQETYSLHQETYTVCFGLKINPIKISKF